MKAYSLDGWARPIPVSKARPSSVLGGQPQWKFETLEHQRLVRAVADWVLIDCHPVSAVEGQGFLQLMRITEPRFVPPSRTYFQHVRLQFFSVLLAVQVLPLIVSLLLFLYRHTFRIYIGRRRSCRSRFYMMIFRQASLGQPSSLLPHPLTFLV